jgi:H+/Cl- antiporter ClcA
LIAGAAGGFGSVFGTPLAGAVFALEVLAIGRLRYDALLPCVLASVLADQVTRHWGIVHATYALPAIPALQVTGLLSMLLAGSCFGLIGMAFAYCTHALGGVFKRYIGYPPLRPLVGGAIVAIAGYALHAYEFLGLGIPTIQAALLHPLPAYDFAGKFGFTTVTLAAGFKGGEVTPLLYIGATLGNALGYVLPLPFTLLAAVGLVAVFAGAANTPLASTLMAMELFGTSIGVYALLACVMAYLCSGHAGIYRAQRIDQAKSPRRPLNRQPDVPASVNPPGEDSAGPAARR